MGIYSNVVFDNRRDDNPIITDTIESIMEDNDIVMKDENEDFVSEGLDIISTITENYNTFMQRVGVSELSAIYTTRDEMIYTESVLGDLFSNIKKFLMKIWDKIKSLFKRFIMMIDSYTKNDKAFITKYRQQIYRHKSLTDFTFKGYQYTIDTGKIKKVMDDLSQHTDKLLTKSKDDIDNIPGEYKNDPYDSESARKYDDKHDERMENLRGNIIKELGGSAGKYTSEEYRKEIDMALRHGEEEKEELTDKEIDVDDMVTELQNYRDTKKTIDTAFKESKKNIDNNNKSIDRLFRDHTKNSPAEDDHEETTPYRAQPNGQRDPELIKAIIKVVGSDNYTLSDGRTVKIDKLLDVVTIVDDDLDNKPGDSGTLAHKLGIQSKVSGVDNLKDALEKKQFNVTGMNYSRSKSKQRSSAFKNALRVTNDTKTMLVTLDTCVLKALKERSRQYKACLVKIVYHNPKNESSFTESYDYDSNYGFNNYISSIEFK